MANRKLTVTMPSDLVRRLKKLPAAKRSGFVKQAIERELDRQDAVAALARMRGKVVWKVNNHPDLLRPKDFARYRAVKDRATS